MILSFRPISNCFQVSKHVIKPRDSNLVLVNVAIEGFIGKPPPEGTQVINLPTFKDPQPTVEDITSSDEEVETEIEDNSSKEDTEDPVRDEDFEIFYRANESEKEELSLHLATASISKDQKVIEVPKRMVIEKKLPDLLFLLESHAGTATPKVPIVPRPLTPIPLALVQTKAADKKRKRDKKGGKGPIEEGEIQEEAPPKPTKVAKVTRAQQRRGVESSDAASE